MQTTAYLRHLRIAPRKVRMITDLIRGKKYEEAHRILEFAVKSGSLPVLKLLNSALANAKQKFNGVPENLRIAKILVDEGPKLKRFRPRARGQAYQIQKKSSHITLVLEEIEPTKKVELQEAEKVDERSSTLGVGKTPDAQKETGPKTPEWKETRKEQPVPRGIRKLPKIFRRKAI